MSSIMKARDKIYVMSLDNRSRMHGRVTDSMNSTLDLARVYVFEMPGNVVGVYLRTELENDQE